MNSLSVGYLGIAAQSFAAFVGLSVLLGRLHFLAYSKTIAIPATSSQISLIDYAIIAPDVTVMGIGIIITAVAHQLLANTSFLTPVEKKDSGRIKIGITLLVLGGLTLLGALLVIAFTHEVALFIPQGVFGLILTLGAAGLWTGSLVAYSGRPLGDKCASGNGDSETQSAESETSDTAQSLQGRATLLRVARALSIGIVIAAVAFNVLHYASMLGEFDARKAIIEAPTAHIEFTPDSANVLDGPDQLTPSEGFTFIVLYTNDSYVFARPIDPETTSRKDRMSYALKGEQKTYAFPHRVISNIVYTTAR